MNAKRDELANQPRYFSRGSSTQTISVSLRAYTRPYGTPGSGRTLVLRDASGMVIPATS